MNTLWNGNVRRAGFASALALALAAEASAYNWCPTQAVNYVTCSSCTVTLTCDVQAQIHITGTNVHLDGNYHWVAFNSGDAVTVTGAVSHITNLGIYAPTGNGIKYASPTNAAASHTASNVEIYYTGQNGVFYNAANFTTGAWIQLMGFDIYYSGNHGVASQQNDGATNLYDSFLRYNTSNGFFSANPGYQTHDRNVYSDNGWNGASNWSSRNAGYFAGSTFDNNGSAGLKVMSVEGPQRFGIYGNSGFGNFNEDCDGWTAGYLEAIGNTWGRHLNCVTTP